MAKELYVNKKEADKIVNDIIKQLENISQSLVDVSNVLEEIKSKNIVNDDSFDLTKILNKCLSQSKIAEKSAYNIDKDYNSDLKDYAITLLDKRIAELESKMSGR